MLMKYEDKIKLYSSYFDADEKLTPKSILGIFQDVAASHAETIGVGYETMLNKNLYWVLSRVKFDIIEMPKPNQIVNVVTWPHEKGRIDFDRDIRFGGGTFDFSNSFRKKLLEDLGGAFVVVSFANESGQGTFVSGFALECVTGAGTFTINFLADHFG